MFLFSCVFPFPPLLDEFLQLLPNGTGTFKQGVPEFFIERGANDFVARGKAQGLDGFQAELAVKAERVLDFDLPIAERWIGENF